MHTRVRITACAEMNAHPTISHVPSLIAVGGPLAGLFAEQAGARLAVAAVAVVMPVLVGAPNDRGGRHGDRRL